MNEISIGFFGASGKTEICLRYLKGEFTEGYIPTIEDEFSKVIDINGEAISLRIIDTAGQDDFPEMRYSYYEKVQGYVIFFDISNPCTIDELKSIYQEILDVSDNSPNIVIGGLNSHLRDEEDESFLISYSDIKRLSSELNCPVIECSSKTGENIDKLIFTLVSMILYGKNYSKSDLNLAVIGINDSSPIDLARKYVFGEYSDSIYENKLIKIVEADNRIFELELQAFNFNNFRSYSEFQGFVLVFDVNDPDPLPNLRKACQTVIEKVGDDLICMIACNHCELRSKTEKGLISYENYELLKNEFNMNVIEVSSATNENVDELFFYLARKMIQKEKQKVIKNPKKRKSKNKIDHKKKKKK